MGTFTSIQGKIDKLQKTVDTLLHMGENASCICVDDLALLNKEIHEQINDLYLYHGETTEQEAALCLSLLMGYSVSMYANPEDEIKKTNHSYSFSKDYTKSILLTIEKSVTHHLQ